MTRSGTWELILVLEPIAILEQPNLNGKLHNFIRRTNNKFNEQTPHIEQSDDSSLKESNSMLNFTTLCTGLIIFYVVNIDV